MRRFWIVATLADGVLPKRELLDVENSIRASAQMEIDDWNERFSRPGWWERGTGSKEDVHAVVSERDPEGEILGERDLPLQGSGRKKLYG